MTIKAQFDGKTIKMVEQERLNEYKAGLLKDAELAVTFEPWSERRTRKQQNLFHEILGRYSRTMGESMHEVKIRWKVDLGHYLVAAEVLLNKMMLPKWRGAWIDLFDVYPVQYPQRTIIFLKSEADYTTTQEKELIDYAIKNCTENQIQVGDILATLDASDA